MGKRIKFRVIGNEDGNGSFIGASLKEVLNAITCDQFCNAVRRAVHLSIMNTEPMYISDSIMKELKREIFPEVSRKSLTSKYHYWKREVDDNTIGRSLGYFFFDYRGQHVLISLVIGFRLKDKKMVVHTEYSASIDDARYYDTTIEGITYQLRNAIDENIKLYEKLVARYKSLGLEAIPVSDELAERLRKAPTIKLSELEESCEEYGLEPA